MPQKHTRLGYKHRDICWGDLRRAAHQGPRKANKWWARSGQLLLSVKQSQRNRRWAAKLPLGPRLLLLNALSAAVVCNPPLHRSPYLFIAFVPLLSSRLDPVYVLDRTKGTSPTAYSISAPYRAHSCGVCPLLCRWSVGVWRRRLEVPRGKRPRLFWQSCTLSARGLDSRRFAF